MANVVSSVHRQYTTIDVRKRNTIIKYKYNTYAKNVVIVYNDNSYSLLKRSIDHHIVYTITP